jgi:hypothetical protein
MIGWDANGTPPSIEKPTPQKDCDHTSSRLIIMPKASRCAPVGVAEPRTPLR